MAKQSMDLIATLEDLYKSAPSLPVNIREVLVKITPWIALIFGVLGVLGGLTAVGFSPLGVFAGIGSSVTLLLSGILTIVASVLMLMAFPKLQKHLYAGWTLLFWSEVVSFVSSVLSLSVGSVIQALIGAAIGFYLLFQIKSYYK